MTVYMGLINLKVLVSMSGDPILSLCNLAHVQALSVNVRYVIVYLYNETGNQLEYAFLIENIIMANLE